MNLDQITKACAIAQRLDEDPKRTADVHRFHEVIIAALNATHDGNGQQDSLALFEGIAHVLAQLVGGFPDPDARIGYLAFVYNRAVWLMDVYREEGNVATHHMVSHLE